MSDTQRHNSVPRPRTVGARLLDLVSWGRRTGSWNQTVAMGEVPPPSLLGEPLPPCLQERYRFRRILGRGGFGVVVLARDMTIGRLVAVKQLYPALMRRPRNRERFLQEARIAGRLAHPNVVTIYTVEETEDSCCLVMEYLGGGSLAQRLQAGAAPAELPVILGTLLGVLEGLEAAHTLGIVHRDLKPENILFDGLGLPRISDFGVAVLTGPGDAAESGEGSAGTPLYMAPEQLDSRRQADPRTDLYALGLIFYELVAGRRLADLLGLEHAPAPGEVSGLAARLPREPVAGRLTPALQALLLSLLAPDPEGRPASAAAVQEALCGHAATLGVQAAMPCQGSGPGTAPPVSRLEALRDMVDLLLADGIMGPGERAELQRRAERLGVDEATVRQVEDQVRAARGLPSCTAVETFARLAEECHGRGEPSPAARGRLAARARDLGISPEEQELVELGLRRRSNNRPPAGRTP